MVQVVQCLLDKFLPKLNNNNESSTTITSGLCRDPEDANQHLAAEFRFF